MIIPPTLDKYHNTIDSSSPDSIIIDYQYNDKQSSNRLHITLYQQRHQKELKLTKISAEVGIEM